METITRKEQILNILGKYKVIGDTTYGLGYKEAEELAEKLENALCRCNNPVENGEALCGVTLDCHLHDWRQKDFIKEVIGKLPRKFWEDEDHAVGGYISKKDLHNLLKL